MCDRKMFPKPVVCPYCLEPVISVGLSQEGSIYAYTVVRVKPPFGLPQPYAVGYVDLMEENLRVFTLFDPSRIDDLRIGAAVVLRIEPLGVNRDGLECLRYFFTPKDRRDQ
jgi:uncharacterized OB-fold protein